MVITALVAALLVTAYRIDPEWISRHVTLLNLWPPYDAQVWSARGRLLLLLLTTLAVLGLRPALTSLFSKVCLGRLARSAGPVLLAIVAAALVVESIVDWVQPKASRGRAVYLKYGTPHPRYGWTGQPSSTITPTVAGRQIHWAFNEQGMRVENQSDEPDPALPTILVAGESIALGFGLEYSETFPARIAARRRIQCVNLAANAYGSDQAYLRLVDAMPRFEHLVATVTVFIPLQLSRNLYDDRPGLTLGPGGDLQFRPARTDFGSLLRIRRLLVNEVPYIGNHAIDRTLALTSAIVRETSLRTRARGATPIFVVVVRGPDRPLVEHPEAWILRRLFVEQGIPFILVDVPPDQLLPGDFHPGPRAEERIAAAVLAALPPGS